MQGLMEMNLKDIYLWKCNDLQVFILIVSLGTVYCAGFPGPMEDYLAAIWDNSKYDLAGLKISYSAMTVDNGSGLPEI